MNAERLALVMTAVRDDIVQTKIIKHLNEIVGTLSSLTSQPTDALHNTLKTQTEALDAAIDSSSFDEFPRTWGEVINELGVDHMMGVELKRYVRVTLETNGITLAKAKEDIQEIVTDLNNCLDAFTKTLEGFEFLEIKDKRPAFGEAELSFIIPRTAISSELKGFVHDANFLHKSLLLFSEIADGHRAEPKLLHTSSSNPLISAVIPCLCLSVYLGTVVDVLDVIGATHKLRELEANADTAEANADVQKAIRDQIKKSIEDGQIGVEQKLLEQFKGEKTRKKELETEVNKIVSGLIKRLDNGYQIDGDTGEPEAAEEGEEVQELSADQNIQVEAAEKIKKLSQEIRFRSLPSDSVLQLPAPNDEVDSESLEGDDNV